MGRGRKGRPLDGWLLIDKPAGLSSAAVVARMRRALNAAKIGHAGTLDPAATGLLILALGEATKLLPVLAEGLKTYRFELTWGAATSTDDAEGEVIEARPKAPRPSQAAIEAALPAFRGAIQQVPPQVSAVKVVGERAYDLARAGESLDLAPRPLWVEALTLEAQRDADHAELTLICGKGGYVRAIARDLGQALGCLAHVHWLRRLGSAPFHVKHAWALEAAEAAAAAGDLPLLPLEVALAGLAEVPLTAPEAARLLHGQAVPAPHVAEAPQAWASHEGQALALGACAGGVFTPSRVLNRAGAAA